MMKTLLYYHPKPWNTSGKVIIKKGVLLVMDF